MIGVSTGGSTPARLATVTVSCDWNYGDPSPIEVQRTYVVISRHPSGDTVLGGPAWRVVRVDGQTGRPFPGDFDIVYASDDLMSEWTIIKGFVALHFTEDDFERRLEDLGPGRHRA